MNKYTVVVRGTWNVQMEVEAENEREALGKADPYESEEYQNIELDIEDKYIL